MRDASAKKAVRQQAMRDIGRARRKPKRNKFIELPLDADAFAEQELPEEVRKLLFPTPVRWLGGRGLDPFIKFPIELDDVGRRLVAFSK
jgi:hypothetical protein